MARASKITQLPAGVRGWLDGALIEKNFGKYDLLAADLAKRGYSIGKSSVHRYGSKLERKLAAIKASTEAARMIAEAAPDDADERSGAVISMTQTGLFNILVDLEEAGEAEEPMQRAKLLSAVAKNVATLTRASITQKKHAIEIRGKATAAADKVARLAKKGGASAATIDAMRREVMGIAA